MIVLREKHIAGFVDFVHRGRLIQRCDPFWLACFRLEQVKSKTKTVIFLKIIVLRSSVPIGKPYRDCCVFFFFLVRVFRIEHTNFRSYRNCIVYFSPLFVGRISRRWLFRISWNVQVYDNTLRYFSFRFFKFVFGVPFPVTRQKTWFSPELRNCKSFVFKLCGMIFLCL